jgi:3-methyladenine DNA glycosylase AlkC
MIRVCKFCKAEFASWPLLKKHCHLDHFAEFKQIEKWLNKTVTPKIESFEKLAEEGMDGRTYP